SYTKEKAIPIYGSEESIRKIKATFSYVFEDCTLKGGGIPNIYTEVVNNSFFVDEQEVVPIKVEHLGLNGCFGFLVGSICYIPDVKNIPEDALAKIKGINLLILNCLRREKPHCSHLTLPESIELAKKIAPKKCLFVHMSHDIHYKKDRNYLLSWMDFAYDGLQIKI
ncbi:MAG: MBL fold metallo-hydrolase, partial [Chitinispirillaceae bacterium]|nr:MBL fold metallo-hydrolase [Chitinispirillaceae bacterium]